MSNMLIYNAHVVPMTARKDIIPRGWVTIRDGAIAAVGAGAPPDVDAGVERIDAGGRVLMPGLVNAHTHLYQVLLRAVWEDLPLIAWLRRIYGAAEVLQPEHFHAGSLLGCVESLKGGVTTVCEHNFLNPHPDCARASVRAIRASGLRAVFARTIMDTGEIVPACVREKPMDAFRRIEELLAEEREASRVSGDTKLTFMTGPNTPPINSSPALLGEIRQFANQNRVGISSHVAESHAVLETVRRECDTDGVMTYLQKFGIPGNDAVFAHCVHVTPDELKIFAETGSSVSHNPVSNMMLGDGVAPVVEMLREGVNVALGTDGAASNHSQDLFETMKAASLLQKVHHQDASVIEPYTVLHMATRGGAKALGLDTVCGSIEPGKRADVILVDVGGVHIQPINDLVSQLVHCAKSNDVDTVIVDGRVLMRARRMTHLDEETVLDAARAAARDLMKRIAANPVR